MRAGKAKAELTKTILMITACVICAAVATPVAAQETVVKPGATVRFRIASGDSARAGQLGALTVDSLVLDSCGNCSRLLYSRAEIKTLEVMHPTVSGDRIISGVLIGGAFGGGLGYVSARSCKGNIDACELSALAIPFGAIAGAVLGGVAAWLSSYKWEPVPAESRTR